MKEPTQYQKKQHRRNVFQINGHQEIHLKEKMESGTKVGGQAMAQLRRRTFEMNGDIIREAALEQARLRQKRVTCECGNKKPARFPTCWKCKTANVVVKG